MFWKRVPIYTTGRKAHREREREREIERSLCACCAAAMASLILFGSRASSLRVLSIPYNSHLRSEYNFTNGFSSKFVSWQKKQWRKCGARRRLAVQASKNESEEDKPSSSSSMSFGDRLLDYIEGNEFELLSCNKCLVLNSPLTFSFWLSGGPKLRKWYGAPDQFTRDGGDGDLREQENNDAGE